MNSIKIISYNLHNHRASSDLDQIASRYGSWVLCLQECDVEKLPQTIGVLRLAGSTLTNRQGLAIYYDPSHVKCIESEAFPLKKSFHDRVMTPADERLLVGCFMAYGQQFQVGCFHAAPLTASNALRRKQITMAQKLLTVLRDETPGILIGDYNYPLFRRKLKRAAAKNGYELTLSDKPTYVIAKAIKAHFDFVTQSGMQVLDVQTLPFGKSDHAPIMAEIRLNQTSEKEHA